MAYTGLTPGNEYKLYTTLMDKDTGQPLTGDDGFPRVGELTFTPETADGTVDVTVDIDTRDLAGKQVVFFEKLTDAEENVIATHEDIDDKGQTVTFDEPEEPAEPDNPGKGYPKTGAFVDVDPVAASLLVIALCGYAGATYAYIRRSRNTVKAIDALEEETLSEKDES